MYGGTVINITYLPALDPFHAAFRLFVLFPDYNAGICQCDVSLILDFYVCFPVIISDFKSPKPLVKTHNILKKRYLPNTYQVTPKPAIMFQRMRAAQIAALSSLQSYGFFERESFQHGLVVRTKKELPERIAETVEKHRQDNKELVEFLDQLKAHSLYGPNGLRARSKLEEYRYDDV
jgi:hypothetical protein